MMTGRQGSLWIGRRRALSPARRSEPIRMFGGSPIQCCRCPPMFEAKTDLRTGERIRPDTRSGYSIDSPSSWAATNEQLDGVRPCGERKEGSTARGSQSARQGTGRCRRRGPCVDADHTRCTEHGPSAGDRHQDHQITGEELRWVPIDPSAPRPGSSPPTTMPSFEARQRAARVHEPATIARVHLFAMMTAICDGQIEHT